MADDTNAGWETAPQGASSLQVKMLANDAALQASHPNWPTGGTAQQLQQESGSNYNMNAVSPKGAEGMVQAMPETKAAVEKQMGRKLDFANVNDQLAFHRYLMNQNLDRSGGDPNGALSLYNSGKLNANNPETNNYVKTFDQKTSANVDSPAAASSDAGGWEQAPTQATSDTRWEAAPSKGGMGSNLEGLGLQAGNLASMALTSVPIAGAGLIGFGRRLIEGQDTSQALSNTVQQAFQNFETFTPETALKHMGVNLKDAEASAGYQFPAKIMDFVGNTIPEKMAPLIAAGIKAQTGYPGDITPQDVSDTKNLLQAMMVIAPAAGELRGRVGKGAPAEVAGKLEPGEDAAAAPSAEAPTGPTPEEQFNAAPTPYRQYFQQPGLFDEGGEGMQPEGPTLAGSTAAEAFPQEGARGSLSNARQQELQLDNHEPIQVNAAGEAMTAEQAAEVAPFRDTMQQRMDDLKQQSADQLDMFNPIEQRQFDQFGENETPRSLTPEEFGETIQHLAEKDGTRFPLPEDMDAAYSRYLDTVRDDQGGLFDRPTIAKNFVDAAVEEALDRRVNDHPTVKANQAKVDSLTAQIASATDAGHATTQLTTLRDQAQRTLEKSQDNIRKFFEPAAEAAAPFYAKDGTVHMYTFGYLPEMMKSIGALLKGIHGVVFKTIDRLIPNFKNLDSAGKIFGQGIKNFVNKEATRDWSQTVNAKPIDQIGKVPGLRDAVTELNPHAQDDLSPEELKSQFNSAPDLTSSKVANALRNNLLQGGLMLSDFSRHPLVKYVTDSVAKSFRSSDKWVRENLLNPKTGLGPMIKRMDLQAFTEIRTLMEAYEGVKEFSENDLKGRGFSDKQIAYYKRSLELQKDAFTKFNAGRELAGLPAVDPRIGHIASYFTGDFKQIVKDAEGRVIAVLGHNNRAALGVIAQRFKEMHPDGDTLDMGKPELRKGSADDNTFNGYMNILDHLSKNNADIQRLIDVYRDTQMANTNKLSQMANRGKFKSNPGNTVGGAEGSKLWQSMQKNAQEGGKQQLKYLESVNRWSEFQQAISKSQDFIKDPEVNAPNAKAVSQRYLDDQMHRNLGELNKFTNSFVNGIAEVTGVGPSQMRGLANFTKTGLLNMFVGLGKFSHSLVTSLQPFIGSPEVTSVLKARGADFGLAQATSMIKGLNSVKDILQSMATGQLIKDPFVRAANEYARANDTFNTSQFNMGSVTHPATKLGTALHINVTVPESGARAATYMRYVHLLKDASDRAPIGDKLTDQEIFGSAHNAVQKVMADYNREAQAPIFQKMGFLGDLTRMLTTFKMNQLSQAATATKMAGEGHIGPMVTMLASSLAASGLRGFIGYNIANGLLGQLSTWATKQGLMTQPTNLDQIILHMLHGMNTHLADALNFGATSALGIDMTGSLSHADDLPDDPLGTLIPEGGTVGKMVSSAAQFVEHPNAQRGKAALYDALPNSMKGIMENMAYTDTKGNYMDPHTGNLVANRSPEDQAKRAFSFRPLEESKMRLQAETARGQNVQLNAVKSEIITRLLSDADSKSLNPQNFRQYAQQYVQAGGNPQELISRLNDHMGMDKHLNIEQREAGIPKGSITAAERYKRAQELK